MIYLANDQAITMGAQAGELELNSMLLRLSQAQQTFITLCLCVSVAGFYWPRRHRERITTLFVKR